MQWVAERSVKIGMIWDLESMELSRESSMVVVWLARSNFTVGVLLQIPMERYWGIYARVPLPLLTGACLLLGYDLCC